MIYRMKKWILLVLCFVLCGCSVPKETVIGCTEGFQEEDGQCVMYFLEPAQYNTSKTCYTSVYNEKLEGSECAYYVSTPANYGTKCPRNYSESGLGCRFRYGMTSLSCGTLQVEYLGKCYDLYTDGTPYYYCNFGTLKGSECVQRYSYPAVINYDYYCNDGFTLTEYNMCVKKVYKPMEEINS